MKKLAILSAILLSAHFSHAQWTNLPGTGNYYLTSGNAGIGINTPSMTLHVASDNPTGQLRLADATNTFWYDLGRISATGGFEINGTQTQSVYYNFKAGTNSIMYLKHDGNVGIGTINPGAALSVYNINPVVQIFDSRGNPLDGGSMGKVAFGSGYGEFASIEVSRLGGAADDLSIMKFKTSWATGAGGDGDNVERMRIDNTGSVSIGTTDSHGYKLAVNGSIRSKEVRVDAGPWPDYVFKPAYRLKSLAEIKTYIDQNRHLPEVPTAAEIEKSGQNLGEMNQLLLKKVEELTLYLIEKDQELKKQQKEINVLKEAMKKNPGHKK